VILYYLDTSVYGGYFDSEFEIVTQLLFDRLLTSEVVIVQSFLTNIEIRSAPVKVRDLYNSIPYDRIIYVDYSIEIDQLAMNYIEQGVNKLTHIADCLHVAAASVTKADALLSWDFKHILREDRILGFMSVNKQTGNQNFQIISPIEALNNEY